MKILPLTCCIALLISSSTSFAQEGLSIGLKGMPQSTWLLNQSDSDAGDVAYVKTWGSAFGLSFNYNFKPGLGVGVDFLLSDQGQRKEFKFNGLVISEWDFDLSYLKIPVMLTFSSDPEANVMFYGNVGPQFSLLQDFKIINKASDQEIDYSFLINDADPKDMASSLDIGVVLGFGLKFKLSESIMLNSGLRLDYGLTDAEDKDLHINNVPFYDSDRGTTSNVTGAFEIGIHYLFSSSE